MRVGKESIIGGLLYQLATCSYCMYEHVLGIKETSLMNTGSSSHQSNNTSSSVEGTIASSIICSYVYSWYSYSYIIFIASCLNVSSLIKHA